MEEVDRYLADITSELQTLNRYPHIKMLYTATNTELLAIGKIEV